MIISHQHKYVYINLAKTASQAVESVLMSHYGGRPSLWNSDLSRYPPDYFVFTVVRDPYARCLSLWWGTCSSPGDRYGFKKYGSTLESLIRWLDGGTAWHSINPDEHVRSRNLFLTMSQDLGEAFSDVNRVLRYESLDKDFRSLPFHTGTPEKLPVVNRKKNVVERKPLDEYLTPGAIEAINEWCGKDFEQFGYEMRS